MVIVWVISQLNALAILLLSLSWKCRELQAIYCSYRAMELSSYLPMVSGKHRNTVRFRPHQSHEENPAGDSRW